MAVVALALTQQSVHASSVDTAAASASKNALTKPLSSEEIENYLNDLEAEQLLVNNLELENELIENAKAVKPVADEDADMQQEALKKDGSKRNNRRQQAARWDIGFGKRNAPSGFKKQKSFMDALYGKRSQFFDSLYGKRGLKNLNNKYSFGRRQQWDIQYGRR